MFATHTNTLPILLPIPELDCHVIRSGQNERLRWMLLSLSDETSSQDYASLATTIARM